MVSKVHKIQSKKLQPFIQYILYNRADQSGPNAVTSFPNTNICLGLSKGKTLAEVADTFVSEESEQNELFAYTTGLYTAPHTFQARKSWDEVCIDFHPCGYYHFFDLPSKPKIIEDGFASSIFSKTDQIQLANILDEDELTERSAAIEALLLTKLRPFEKRDLQLAVTFIHANHGLISVKDILKHTQCSERKLYRLFEDHFGITPKWYLRIVRIRQALKLMTFNPRLSLTEVAYQCGYTDQSHFIREAKSMCDLTPKKLKNNLLSIDNEVIISKV